MNQQNPPTQPRTSFTTKKKLLIAGSILITLALLVYFALSQVSSVAESRLLDLANEELQPNAELTIGDLSISFFPASISLHNVNLVHSAPFEDQTASKPLDAIRYFEMEKAELRGVNLIRMIAGREWSLRNLEIEGVQLDIVPTTTDRVTDSSPFENPFPVVISEATLRNSHFRIFPTRSSDSPVFVTEDITLDIVNLKIDDPDGPVHDYFDDFTLNIREVRQVTENGFYDLTGHKLFIDSREGKASLESFHSNPLLSAYEITTSLEHEEDRFDIEGGPFLFDRFNVKEWLENEDIEIGYADLQNLSIEIVRDKTYPNPPRDYRELPHSQFAGLPFSVKVDSVKLSDGLISYSEQYKEEDRKGTIEFADLNMTIRNIQNRSDSEPVTVNAVASLMNATELRAEFEFYPSERATHIIRAEIDEMDLDHLNNPLENMAAVRVSDGVIKSLMIDITLDEEKASGELRLIYSDLSIRFLDEESMEEGTRSRIMSFLTNTFAVRSDNPEDDPRIAEIEFDREKDRSMFNYWWNTIKEGLLESVKR